MIHKSYTKVGVALQKITVRGVKMQIHEVLFRGVGVGGGEGGWGGVDGAVLRSRKRLQNMDLVSQHDKY